MMSPHRSHILESHLRTHVAVTKHPFWYPLSAIEEGISTSINKALAAECS